MVESGGADSAPTISNPSIWFYNVGSPLDWSRPIALLRQLNDRKFNMALGRVLGGGSSINAMVWSRGMAIDYDNWERNGAAGWAFQDVLPTFKAQEDWEGGANQWRGVGGPVHVRKAGNPHPTAPAFIEAARQMGFASRSPTFRASGRTSRIMSSFPAWCSSTRARCPTDRPTAMRWRPRSICRAASPAILPTSIWCWSSCRSQLRKRLRDSAHRRAKASRSLRHSCNPRAAARYVSRAPIGATHPSSKATILGPSTIWRPSFERLSPPVSEGPLSTGITGDPGSRSVVGHGHGLHGALCPLGSLPA